MTVKGLPCVKVDFGSCGTDVADGLVCLPGTHSKWARIEKGAITDFASFMTGESYALYRHESLLARLAAEPEDLAGFDDGLEAARDEGGLLNRLFQARARVLDGAMTGEKVGPFLSGLLIGAEIEGAFRRYGGEHLVTLVADGVIAGCGVQGYAFAIARVCALLG